MQNLTFDLKSATAIINLTLMCMLYLITILGPSKAMMASKLPQWPQRCYAMFDMKSVTLTSPISIGMMPQTAIFEASEAIATSKWTLRSLVIYLKSVASTTYVAMLFWPLRAILTNGWDRKFNAPPPSFDNHNPLTSRASLGSKNGPTDLSSVPPAERISRNQTTDKAEQLFLTLDLPAGMGPLPIAI